MNVSMNLSNVSALEWPYEFNNSGKKCISLIFKESKLTTTTYLNVYDSNIFV